MSLPVVASPHLLVVDDDLDILETVQVVLSDQGYEVTPAPSLPAALSLLEEQPFHLVLSDLFARQVDAPLHSIHPLLAQAEPIPVGVMTAWPVPVEAAAPAGLAFLLPKPFELDALVRAVQSGMRPRLTGKER